MEWSELLGTLGVSITASVPLAIWLSKKLIEGRLNKDLSEFNAGIAKQLAEHKATLDKRLNEERAEVEAKRKQEVELLLGDAAADRTYRSEAKKRLYQAIGPLRFQLLVAAAEWTNRVARIGSKDSISYDMSLEGHFLRSTAYRLLRLIALAELIERQIAYADFSVDPEMRSLLKFKRQAGQCLSSSDVSRGHRLENWGAQEQHVFSDTISTLAAKMIVPGVTGTPERVARFDEFQALLGTGGDKSELHPVPYLMADFSPSTKPLLWLRMLALSQLCIGLLERQGKELGLELQAIDLERLLDLASDDQLMAAKSDYVAALLTFRTALDSVSGRG